MTKNNSIFLTECLRLAECGLSLIPIRPDGSKAPTLPAWKTYQSRRATAAELHGWFGAGTVGVAVVNGIVSGCLETLDFDELGLLDQWLALAADQGWGELVDTLPIVQTPSGGYHVYFRSDAPPPGNLKLARTAERAVRIETRGEGGYALIPPSPAACHPDRKPYLYLRGHLALVPTLAAEERDALIHMAQVFNEFVEPSRETRPPPSHSPRNPSDLRNANDLRNTSDLRPGHISDLRPGDDYNARGDWQGLLERHGWARLGQRAGRDLWRRPGKARGISATSGFGGDGAFYVFSSNAAPFESETAYGPFAVYATLEHGGDWAAAAKALAAEGYGEPPQKPSGGSPAPVRADSEAPPVRAAGSRKARGGGAGIVPPGASPPAAPGDAWEPPLPFGGGPLPPFPVEVLPPVLQAYVSEVAASRQAPVDMAAMMALACVSIAGARRCEVAVGDTHLETLNGYFAVVMQSGSRKSGVLEDFALPLREFERGAQQAGLSEYVLAKERHKQQTCRLETLRGRIAREKDEVERRVLESETEDLVAGLTDVQELPRLLADDVTMERMAGLLAEQSDNCLAILSAEGGIFALAAGRYNNGAVNLDLLLKGHGGETYKVDRVGQPPRIIERSTLTLGLAVQPDVLQSLSDNKSFRGRGLLGRFLFSVPENMVGTRLYQNRPVDPAAREAYLSLMEHLLALPEKSTREQPGLRHRLRIEGEALTVWAHHYDEVERRQADGENLSGVSDWASKLAGAVARIAANLHLVTHQDKAAPWALPIGADTVKAAWAIGDYLIPHALAAFSQIGADDNPLAVRLLKWMPKWARREGKATFSIRDCTRSFDRAAAPEELELALARLTARGYVRLQQADYDGVGRKPGPVYAVHPSLLEPAEAGEEDQGRPTMT